MSDAVPRSPVAQHQWSGAAKLEVLVDPIMPLQSPPSRWRWGVHGMVIAFVASIVARAAFGGKVGLVVLLVLLLANGAATAGGRAPRS